MIKILNIRELKALDIYLMKMKYKDYYKPKLVSTAFRNNYLQYQTGSDRKIYYHLLNILKRLNQI